MAHPQPVPAQRFLPKLSSAQPFRCAGRWAVWGLATTLLVPSFAIARVTPHREAHQDPWEKAVAMRDKLEASAPQQRTRERYEAVLDAFRAIYHQHPDSSKAPAAVAAVADLL